ncbi:oxygen-independent coproporphyrinogen III oxidase [Wenyingzhuangia sp. 2_MG-2023]|uniref:oxygen-independent coproporphyrinogen III oxidase n=1 Tax=Wenyingzhuangia sp. 2_MG-2023 TaxID=3062639 RepID=UPI0026E4264D|nr:oxygen-independent coproporphyrinogen III oxidase [Wenyingzhuangia sp. 2_MG-2023]MDO6738945.1 oxygen-independent coproporphyrinogen III oxidase [Wenyingzhuangia sp. 2_MG-2023]
MDIDLINKYNVPGPRYTSYPTVPHWNVQDFRLTKWKKNLLESYHKSNKSQGISLYIHLPFCDSMCTFCGCNKRITKRHDVESPYIDAVLKEWSMYLNLLDEKPVIKELHIGGGTPTFFSPENLKSLLSCIINTSTLAENYEFSFEGHPNNTTKEHLQTLFDLGFKRVSFGVQDYNKTVQAAIHRIQPFENVKKVTEWAREIGYTSVGHDIIYGLPFQTLTDVENTLEKTKSLAPDRIAFYSYAHVPWLKGNGQRGYSEENLPQGIEKLMMYETGKKILKNYGYYNIGMDHFSLPTNSLYQALKNHKLHRNFMGYTHAKTEVMIGLGVSSIGDSWNSFYQNVKNIEEYQELVKNNIFPIAKGHISSKEDLIIRQHILNLMCHYETKWDEETLKSKTLEKAPLKMFPLLNDGLISISKSQIKVTDKGKPFIRNICMAIDQYLGDQPQNKFSKTV